MAPVERGKKDMLNVALLTFILFCSATVVSLSFSPTQPVICEETVVAYATPKVDDSASNLHFGLLPYHWDSTIGYYINTGNWYGFPSADVVNTITLSANTWDRETPFQVFLYKGTTSRIAGLLDGRNVISWGYLGTGILAITYLWIRGSRVIETDCRLNIYYSWSLSGEPRKIDLQSVMTHEFGHWCGLKDLYSDADYWLTMYGYSGYGLTYQRTLGFGDIIGLRTMYGWYTEVLH
jgi:hypothetical protein